MVTLPASTILFFFIPDPQVHFIPTFLEFQVAGLPQLPQDIGWLCQTFQIFMERATSFTDGGVVSDNYHRL